MRTSLIPVILFFAALICVSRASAEVSIKEVHWQMPGRSKGVVKAFSPIEKWAQPPAARTGVKPRALVTLVNRGPKPAEGIVLRYAVAARLVKIGGDGKDGVWTVPFWMEERRVPWITPNQVKDIPIDQMVLDMFLKKSFRAGFWPDALRIQVMVEPREATLPLQGIVEETLAVTAGP